MRLYIKLFAMLLIAASVQSIIRASEKPSEVWFGLRCSFAYFTHDDQMIGRLVDEARQVDFYDPIRVSAAGGG